MNADNMRAIVKDAEAEIEATVRHTTAALHSYAQQMGLRFTGLEITLNYVKHRDLITPTSEMHLIGVKVTPSIGI